jgi:uncharacterized protein (TIGR03437 family)
VAGGNALCEILYEATGEAGVGEADVIDFAVSTSSDGLQVPSVVRGRGTRSALQFEVHADDNGSLESVAIEAQAGQAVVRDSLLVLPAGRPHLRLPSSLTAMPGALIRFNATAVGDGGAPVPVSIANQPAAAAFDPVSGAFEWIPAERDLGKIEVTFNAADSHGIVVRQAVHVDIVPLRPTLSGIQNGAGPGAVAACSPGALATLIGTGLAGGLSGEATRVLVNRAEASVVRISGEQVDFLCPQFAPGVPLDISAEVNGQSSNEIHSIMQETSPGLLSTDGSGSGQGLIFHARGLAALPRHDRTGMPGVAGEPLTFYATGIRCDKSSANARPLLYLGHDYQPITLLRQSALSGVCEIHSVTPAGVSGNEVKVFIESVGEDGTPVKSNIVFIAIE